MGQVTDSSPHSSFLISHDLCKHSKGDTLVTAGRRPAAVPRQKRIRPVPRPFGKLRVIVKDGKV